MERACDAIAADGLTKRYGHSVALADLTMRVPHGEIFGFLGPNGAGKTTAVKLFLGLAKPTSGTGSVLGKPLGDLQTRRRIGYLPELFRYQDWLSAREVLKFHALLCDIPRALRGDHIAARLRSVGLAERADDRVASFSKGMQQRLGLAVALLGDPELVFLDEPTSALDPVGRHEVREIVRGLRAGGTTVFLNSHLLSEIEQVCDRVAVIERGSIIASGSVGELLKDPRRRVRLQLGPLNEAARALIANFEVESTRDGVVELANVPPQEIPQIVRGLVEAGVVVHAVEPRRQSLEERFIELLRD